MTIIIGHATFCVVVVYNNVIARLRRTSGSFDEASADLGADPLADVPPRDVPAVRTALLAGGLLAFALSWDEVVVTDLHAGAQQTLPTGSSPASPAGPVLPIVNASRSS